ncbi:hypothetical protein [Micromonospora psammae]|uniref:hypothetical protein n=1 Tax=Micromonospora sp. CPCC 205556 TaxID=3122398 RepID=UPI002FEFA2CB
MSETGQPGAATPGEHGDGTGQQDDPARSASGWAPPATGWSGGADAPRGREPAAPWRRSEPTTGWGASSPHHGDLPAPFSSPPADGEPAPRNGHTPRNGVSHPDEESPLRRSAPMSAPPVDAPRYGVEPRRDGDGDQLVVPAQRPVPPAEQQEPDAAGRHLSEEPPGPRVSRWSEGNFPASAPPAVQVPPPGTAPSGFEVPPGFHAPQPDAEPARATEPPAWADRFPAELPAAGPDPRAAEASAWADRYPADSDQRAEPAAEHRPPPADEPDWTGPSWNRPSWGGSWAPSWAREEDQQAGRRARAEWAAEPSRPYEPVRAEPARPYEPVRAEPARPYEPVRSELPRPYEVTRSEPEPPPAQEAQSGPGPAAPDRADRGRAEDRPVGPDRAAAPAADRAAADWAAADRAHAGDRDRDAAGRALAADRDAAGRDGAGRDAAGRVLGSDRSVGPDRAAAGDRPVVEQRAAWGGGRAAAPSSAPPAPSNTSSAPSSASSAPSSAPPAPAERPVAERAEQPFRLRSVPEEPTPAEPPGHLSTPTGPGAATVPATSGARRPDRTSSAPAPTSAPPYAARRSAPDPAPTSEPAVDDLRSDRDMAVLPQRVPAEPDVPVVPEPPAVEPPAETPELARIATHLRREDEPAPLRERPEGFDVNAILDAVREVAGVRDAALRRTPAGAHSLRLDLSDGADPAEVSRMVARLLQERMGLAAAPQNLPGSPAAPLRRRAAESRTPQPRAGEPRDRAGDAEPRRAVPREQDPGAVPVADPAGTMTGVARRRRQGSAHRGRASVEEATAGLAVPATGSPVTGGTSYSGGQMTTTETAPSRPLDTGGVPGPRVVIDHVQVSTFGLDATVEVRLLAGGEVAAGHSFGPAVDGYVLRLCAVAAAAAVDQLLRGAERDADRGRCFVEHAAVVPFGNCEVATVVVLLVCDGWVEQLAGSALVAGDPRQAVVRATLAAVNRRLEALLA